MTKYKYSNADLEQAVEESVSVFGVMRVLGIKLSGSSHQHISNRIKKEGIDKSHFTGAGHLRGKTSPRKKSAKEILIIMPEGSKRQAPYRLRRALLESGVEYKCVGCNLDSWQGESLTLEVDHIDGNWLNNLITNLRLMCPNCHSQCPTSTRQRTK